MTHFDETVQKVTDATAAPRPSLAEVTLDLSGHSETAAMDKLNQVLTFCVNTQVKTLYLSFPPARPGEGTSLFQPLARALKTAKDKGVIISAQPVMSPETAGLFVRLSQG